MLSEAERDKRQPVRGSGGAVGAAARGAETSRHKLSKKSKSLKSAAKKSKRNPRPPRAVRLSQAERRMRPRYNQGTYRDPQRIGVSVTVHMPRLRFIPALSRRVPRKLPARLMAMVSAPLAAKFGTTHRLGERLARQYPVVGRLRRPAFAVLAFAAVVVVISSAHVGHHKLPASTGQAAAAAVRTAPSFKPLVPSANEASTTTYDGKRDMVAYATTFSGARLTVSQQPLPLKFAHDPNALQVAADSIVAKQRIDTAKGPLYTATNDQGDQLAVFASPRVLLFIHSDRKLDDASWKAFIELLQPKS